MNDIDFNVECLKLYEAGKLPWPEWKLSKPYAIRKRLFYHCVAKDAWGWITQFANEVGSWARGYVQHDDYEAACINERALREWLRKHGAYAFFESSLHGNKWCVRLWGKQGEGRSFDIEGARDDERPGLTAAVWAVLETPNGK